MRLIIRVMDKLGMVGMEMVKRIGKLGTKVLRRGSEAMRMNELNKMLKVEIDTLRIYNFSYHLFNILQFFHFSSPFL